MSKPLSLTREQVRWFRARRTGLAAPLPTLGDAAAASVGIQSQQLAPSLWGVAQRARGQAAATEVKAQLFEEPRSLVRTWGQRGTVHLYAVEHWRRVIASKPVWAVDVRRGVMAPDDLVAQAHEQIVAQGGVVLRSDLMPLVTGVFLKEAADYVGSAMDPQRLGASRLIWQLAVRGELTMGDKVGQEQSYVLRKNWFPKLKWSRVAASRAATDLARDYLSTCGPATVHDLAHFFGSRIPEAQKWVDTLQQAGELSEVIVADGDERVHYLLNESIDEVRQAAPTSIREWEVALLPMWDGLLMSHADKAWSVPVEAERKAIWKKAAMVSPVVLARGVAVATWAHKARAKQVDVTLTPLSGWRKSKHLASATRAAQRFAAHLGRDEALITVADS